MASFDGVIIGGGPAGLSAALALGRARRRVLLCDGGPRRNQAATEVHNFLTRDGTPPETLRSIGREQLAPYGVELRNARVERLTGSRNGFELTLGGVTVQARRVLLATGMIDELPALEGAAPFWGHSVFQCPYCHGWEARDRAWGYWVRPQHLAHALPFALQLLHWTRTLTVFTGGGGELPAEAAAALLSAGAHLESTPIARLSGEGHQLERVELTDGRTVACQALFAHPPQQQVELVKSLGLGLDEEGFVKVDWKLETSQPGIFAAGDLTTRMQAAIAAASAGMMAGAMVNVDLAMDRSGPAA